MGEKIACIHCELRNTGLWLLKLVWMVLILLVCLQSIFVHKYISVISEIFSFKELFVCNLN